MQGGTPGTNPHQDHLVLSPGDTYFLHRADVQGSSDLDGALDPGANSGLDSVARGTSKFALTAPL
jgi:hypothetical protein